jgi:hypothetical protein
MACLFLQPVEPNDDAFWNQFWSESVTCVQDVFTLIPAAEIRALREESPSNLATLCYKAVEKLVEAAESGCRTQREQQMVLNCVRLLTRILPYIFEEPDWRGFFWSTLPGQSEDVHAGGEVWICSSYPLLLQQSLLSSAMISSSMMQLLGHFIIILLIVSCRLRVPLLLNLLSMR